METFVRLEQQGLRAPALKTASCMRNMLDVDQARAGVRMVRVSPPSRLTWQTGKSTSAMPFPSLQTLRSVTYPSLSRKSLSTFPQAQASSLAQRVQFLEAKGLTGPEIEEALRQANSSRPLPSHIQQPPYSPVYGPLPYVPQLNPPWDWRDYFVRAATTQSTLGELMG